MELVGIFTLGLIFSSKCSHLLCLSPKPLGRLRWWVLLSSLRGSQLRPKAWLLPSANSPRDSKVCEAWAHFSYLGPP